MNFVANSEKIEELAIKHPEAREVLRQLFPEIFEQRKYLDLHDVPAGLLKDQFRDHNLPNLIDIRTDGAFAFRGFSLHPEFEWELKQDEHEYFCLIPHKKMFY